MNSYAIAAWNASWDAPPQTSELGIPTPRNIQDLHTPDKPPALPQDATKHGAANTNEALTPFAQPVPANDPLGAVKAMSEEEKIALFT